MGPLSGPLFYVDTNCGNCFCTAGSSDAVTSGTRSVPFDVAAGGEVCQYCAASRQVHFAGSQVSLTAGEIPPLFVSCDCPSVGSGSPWCPEPTHHSQGPRQDDEPPLSWQPSR